MQTLCYLLTYYLHIFKESGYGKIWRNWSDLKMVEWLIESNVFEKSITSREHNHRNVMKKIYQSRKNLFNGQRNWNIVSETNLWTLKADFRALFAEAWIPGPYFRCVIVRFRFLRIHARVGTRHLSSLRQSARLLNSLPSRIDDCDCRKGDPSVIAKILMWNNVLNFWKLICLHQTVVRLRNRAMEVRPIWDISGHMKGLCRATNIADGSHKALARK